MAPFTIPAERIPRCIFGSNLLILAQIQNKVLSGKAKISYKNDIQGKDKWSPYWNQTKVSQDACLVQIWWFQPGSVKSYRADKPKVL